MSERSNENSICSRNIEFGIKFFCFLRQSTKHSHKNKLLASYGQFRCSNKGFRLSPKQSTMHNCPEQLVPTEGNPLPCQQRCTLHQWPGTMTASDVITPQSLQQRLSSFHCIPSGSVGVGGAGWGNPFLHKREKRSHIQLALELSIHSFFYYSQTSLKQNKKIIFPRPHQPGDKARVAFRVTFPPFSLKKIKLRCPRQP